MPPIPQKHRGPMPYTPQLTVSEAQEDQEIQEPQEAQESGRKSIFQRTSMPELPPVPPPRSKERLAINLFDIERIVPDMRQRLLGGRLDLTTPVWIDKNKGDEYALAFTCSLLEAATICDIIRNHDRQVNDLPTRVYIYKKTWSKLGRSMVLTHLESDEAGNKKCSLNAKLFQVDVIMVPLVPLECEPVD